MGTQLDLTLATAKRDEALEQVALGVTDAWKDRAFNAVLQLPPHLVEFTSDDIWATGLEKPTEPRALGVVLMKLCRDGHIAKTGRYVKTAQVSRHAAPIAVWRFTFRIP